MKRTCLVLLGLAVLLFCGCSYKSYFEVTKGEFEIMEVEHFNGAGKCVPQQTSLKGFSVSASYANDKYIPMDVSNKKQVLSDTVAVPNSKFDFDYERPNTLLISGEGSFMYKGDIALSGISLGVTSLPLFYIRASVGANMRNVEGGLFAYYALGETHASFSGYWYHPTTYDMGFTSHAYKEQYESDRYARDISTAGLGGYGSVYAGPVALSSSVSLSTPWRDRSEDLDLTFDFPYLIRAYVGASVWMGDHVKVSAGVSDYVNAKKLRLSFGGSVGYWL